jgi:hypothetical protein
MLPEVVGLIVSPRLMRVQIRPVKTSISARDAYQKSQITHRMSAEDGSMPLTTNAEGPVLIFAGSD